MVVVFGQQQQPQVMPMITPGKKCMVYRGEIRKTTGLKMFFGFFLFLMVLWF